MARCEGTTRSGSRCRLDARPGSPFCHLHLPGEDPGKGAGDGTAYQQVEWDDLLPLLLAGAAAAGLLFLVRSLGRWIPRF